MKIIFLDIDGVLTTPDSCWGLIKDKLALIGQIVFSTEAKIVITSSWAVGCKTAEEFIEKTFSKDMRDSLFVKSIIDVTEQAEYWDDTRGKQIERWLGKHEDEVENYVIIDDDADFLDEQLFSFVQTDTFEGITEREVKLAIKLLKKQRIDEPSRLNNVLLYKRFLANPTVEKKDNYYKLLREYYFKTEI